MSPRGPSGALKSLFKNLKKPCVFTRLWVQRPPKRPSRGPRAAQETPKELQNAMQKSTKKNHKKCLLGRKCLKPAISKRPPLRPLFSPPSLHIFVNIFYICLKLFRKMLKLILEPILGSERPKRAKMSPKEPSGASKNQKPSFSKTLKNLFVF